MTDEETKKDLEDKAVERVKKVPMLEVKSTSQIKLKDKEGRGGFEFNIRQLFGFYPEKIVVQKVAGRNNVIVVSAVLTDNELLREKKKDDKPGKENKAVDEGQEAANN